MYQNCINKTMNTFLGNTISKLYNAVSASVTATWDALTKRLQSVRDITSLLYNKMMENMGYGQQERLKDIVEKEAQEEEQPVAATQEEEQQQGPAAQDDERYDTVAKIKLMRKWIQGDRKFNSAVSGAVYAHKGKLWIFCYKTLVEVSRHQPHTKNKLCTHY